jgi:glycosyltransferase involved in cell wall biosynthesis
LSSGSQTHIDLTIFVPCYNEAGAIEDVLTEISDCMRGTGLKYEIIIVDDNSTDPSVSLIRRFASQRPDVELRVIVNEVNRGLSHNYTNAAFLGRGEYFCRVSGHFQDRREAILPLVGHMGEADMIIGYLAEDHRGLFRRLLSRFFTGLVNALSGHRVRYYLGVVIFRRSLVLRWHSYRHQAFQADMITRILDEGHSHLQFPIRAHQRPAGRSRAITVKNFLSVGFCLADILGRRILRRPRTP